MLDFVGKTVTKIFGKKSDRDLKKLLPYVESINNAWQQLTGLSDDELRGKTDEVKETIDGRLKEIDDKLAELRQKAEEDTTLTVNDKNDLFKEVDDLEEERNKELEKVLEEVLPVAFGIVKETARRLKENHKLVVTASFKDKQFAATRSHVDIEGEQAIWHNKWMAAGNEIIWDMVHYDVQLVGGVVLHQGKIAEMATGEGKTLVATLPAFLNALARRGVHVVTVNDYLAKRDSEWMAPLFEFHGMTVDCIDKYEPHSPQRQQAYEADVTYGTNNEFGFDYLRDNMAHNPEEIVQRRHHYAMIDEIDSILIDDARTPLIISGPIEKGDQHEYTELKPKIHRLVDVQKKVVQGFMNEAKKKLKSEESNDVKEAGVAMFRAFRGLPKSKPLIKLLSETGNQGIMRKAENYYLQDNSKNMPEADEPLYFTIDEKNNQVELTDRGVEFITGNSEDKNFFILPDIAVEIGRIKDDEELSDEEKVKQEKELISEFSVKTERIHSVQQLLKAYTLFEKDTDYIIVDNQVKIVDEQTGRVMEGRRYSDGLHQALEAKENVKIEDATQTYATVTLQNYFRMYHKLAGMTGTAETEAGEFWDIYKLDVVVIPTNKPIARDDRNDLVFKTAREKFKAVIDEVVRLTEAGRPVLVGTTSVEVSELLSRMLTLRKLNHQVLNAKLHQKEADVVAEAGKPGTVTIATNMAGRGTDIKLTPESKASGGLAIIGTERHESRRVDRQLRGRSGRQGDPGSSQFFVSLEDNLMRLFGSDRIAKIMDRMGLKDGEVIQHSMVTKSIERAQKKVEENNFAQRKRLLEYDDVMNEQRKIIYKRRRNALYGDRLELDTLNTIYSLAEIVVNQHHGVPENYDGFKLDVIGKLSFDTKISQDEFNTLAANVLTEQLFEETYTSYQNKNKQIIELIKPALDARYEQYKANAHELEDAIPFTMDGNQTAMNIRFNLKKAFDTEGRQIVKEVEKLNTLLSIDQQWKEHLRDMDDMKQSVQNAVYEQKDPIVVYKFEAYELFAQLNGKINNEVGTALLAANLAVFEDEEEDVQIQQGRKERRKKRRLNESKADAGSAFGDGSAGVDMGGEEIVEKQAPVKVQKMPSRNAKVTVQYTDGTVKKDVKFKTVEDDFRNNKCVLIEQ
ncbi:preprotein translocase subunit SecA [marine bacterium AO1-C]|nr:preprotein translocase subunit SecA [marine bacterium AO1-C]